MKKIFPVFLIFAVINFTHSKILFANGEDTVVTTNGKITSNDTIILFVENFDDGDLTNNPEWAIKVPQRCAPQPAKVEIIDGALK